MGSKPFFAAVCMNDSFGPLQTFVVFVRPSELPDEAGFQNYDLKVGFEDCLSLVCYLLSRQVSGRAHPRQAPSSNDDPGDDPGSPLIRKIQAP